MMYSADFFRSGFHCANRILAHHYPCVERTRDSAVFDAQVQARRRRRSAFLWLTMAFDSVLAFVVLVSRSMVATGPPSNPHSGSWWFAAIVPLSIPVPICGIAVVVEGLQVGRVFMKQPLSWTM